MGTDEENASEARRPSSPNSAQRRMNDLGIADFGNTGSTARSAYRRIAWGRKIDLGELCIVLPANRKSVNTRIPRVGKPQKGKLLSSDIKRSAQQALMNGAHQRAQELS